MEKKNTSLPFVENWKIISLGTREVSCLGEGGQQILYLKKMTIVCNSGRQHFQYRDIKQWLTL